MYFCYRINLVKLHCVYVHLYIYNFYMYITCTYSIIISLLFFIFLYENQVCANFCKTRAKFCATLERKINQYWFPPITEVSIQRGKSTTFVVILSHLFWPRETSGYHKKRKRVDPTPINAHRLHMSPRAVYRIALLDHLLSTSKGERKKWTEAKTGKGRGDFQFVSSVISPG